MVAGEISGRDIVTALTKNRVCVVDFTGSPVKHTDEHPTNEIDDRVVTVSMHDRIDTGTLRNIADQGGAPDFWA